MPRETPACPSRGDARHSAVFVFIASLLTTAPAAADSLRFGAHADFGRIAFDWDMPVEYTATVTEGVLEVGFARPLTGDVAPSVRVLAPYVTAAEVDAERQRARFTLRPGVSMRTYKLGNVVVVDLRAGGDASPTAAASTPSASNRSAVGVRTGTHPGFFRLAFDWPTRVEYHIERRGDRLAVVFAGIAAINVDAVNRRLPAQNRPAEVVVENGATVVLIPFAAVFAVDHFRNANTIAIDLTDKPAPPLPPIATAPVAEIPPAAPLAESPREVADAKAAPQPAPDVKPPLDAPARWSVRPHVDVGYTYYRINFDHQDPLTGLGPDTPNYRITDRSLTGNYLAAAYGRPRRYAFMEGTVGFNVNWEDWWGDIYYRTALHDPFKTTSSTLSYTAERFLAPGSATRETNIITYSSDPNFTRDQYGLTLGYTFGHGISAHLAYLNSRTSIRGARSFSTARTVESYPNTISGFPLVGPACCASSTTTNSPLIPFKESIATHSLAAGMGYAVALDANRKHFVNVGGGLAYSRASGQYVDGTSLGAWGNVGYQFYVGPNVALSLSGEGYRFDYAGTRGFSELWASGRFGLSYFIN